MARTGPRKKRKISFRIKHEGGHHVKTEDIELSLQVKPEDIDVTIQVKTGDINVSFNVKSEKVESGKSEYVQSEDEEHDGEQDVDDSADSSADYQRYWSPPPPLEDNPWQNHISFSAHHSIHGYY